MQPSFFIIGMPRSGTTTLYHYLSQHPDIFMSHPKEPNYFNKDNVVEALDWMPNNTPFPFTKTEEEYLKLFNKAKGKISGEATINYFYSEDAPKLIKKFNPDAKLILIIREPISFLESFYNQLFFIGLETIPSFTEALDAEKERKEGHNIPKTARYPSQLHYSDKIRYLHHINRWLDHFPREQLKILIYDDFKENNLQYYKEILNFLEQDTTFSPNIEWTNTKKILKTPSLQTLSKRISSRNRQIQSLLPKPLYKLSKTIYDSLLKSKNNKNISPQLKKELRQKYKKEVENLSTFLDRDLITLWGY